MSTCSQESSPSLLATDSLGLHRTLAVRVLGGAVHSHALMGIRGTTLTFSEAHAPRAEMLNDHNAGGTRDKYTSGLTPAEETNDLVKAILHWWS
jgi:hypothetical protein